MKNYTPTNWITLEQKEKFLETYNLSRLNYQGIENLKRLIMNKETDSVMRNLPMKKRPGTDCFTSEFYQIFRELTQIFLMPPIIKQRKHTQSHFQFSSVQSLSNVQFFVTP